MSKSLLKGMSAIERRSFIKGALKALPVGLNIGSLRYLLGGLAGESFAQNLVDEEPTFFLEVNLRDQWDFSHVMVPPSLATAAGPIRGTTGRKLALFYDSSQLIKCANGIYLTPASKLLEPHSDTIACMELCELSMGTIHGHEAANAIRSPGRSYQDGRDRLPMWERDPVAKGGGNEYHYSSTPTLACLHNHVQRSRNRDLRNGIAFKGIGRSIHTVYHFPHRLSLGDLDRHQSGHSLVSSFRTETESVVASAAEAETLSRILAGFDERTLNRAGFRRDQWLQHKAMLDGFVNALHKPGGSGAVSLEMTPQEIDYWTKDIPAQRSVRSELNIGEQVAYACKLFQLGLIRTASLEYDYVDVHDSRTPDQLDVMAYQTALPLARAISYLKDAGIYDRTLISFITLDGGRSPAADSYGSEGKNGCILAGGMIRGGYYGDIQIAGPDRGGHRYRYHPPTGPDGRPHPTGTIGKDLRVSGASMWRTMGTALKIPADALRYPDVSNSKILDYLLKT